MLRPQLLYHVARNSRGSLPVYSDVRNAGSRYLVYIRNVDGNVSVSILSFFFSIGNYNESHRPWPTT